MKTGDWHRVLQAQQWEMFTRHAAGKEEFNSARRVMWLWKPLTHHPPPAKVLGFSFYTFYWQFINTIEGLGALDLEIIFLWLKKGNVQCVGMASLSLKKNLNQNQERKSNSRDEMPAIILIVLLLFAKILTSFYTCKNWTRRFPQLFPGGSFWEQIWSSPCDPYWDHFSVQIDVYIVFLLLVSTWLPFLVPLLSCDFKGWLPLLYFLGWQASLHHYSLFISLDAI